MDYVYPAIFHKNNDGSFTVTYPDLVGCITEGKNLENAMRMAQSALTQWINYLQDQKQAIPQPSKLNNIQANTDEFVNFIFSEIKDKKAVKRTVSLPKWLDEKVTESGLSLSRVLQDALTEKLV